MRNVTPEVFLLAQSRSLHEGAEKWLQQQGVGEGGICRLMGESVGCGDQTSAETIVQLAGRRCYKSFEVGLNPNIMKIREDVVEYIDNILKVGHGSVLEHVTFTFALENVSRVFTAEMNRHRAGCAISEGSMRFIRLEDIPYWIPTSIQENMDDSPGLRAKKQLSRDLMAVAFQDAEYHYKKIVEVWKDELAEDSKFKDKKAVTSMMRRIIPIGVASGGVWTLNLRALRHVFEMRCSEQAEEEILLVATKMLDLMRDAEPSFFGDFTTGEKGFSVSKYKKV